MTRTRMFPRTLCAPALALALAACNQLEAIEEETDSAAGGTVPQAVLDAFQNSCALGTACHGAGGQTPALEAGSIAGLIGTNYVNIGDIPGSYIAVKMLSQSVLDNIGATRMGMRMPLGFDFAAGDPATLENTEIILAWIAGAEFPGGGGGSTGDATTGGMTDTGMTTGAPPDAAFDDVQSMVFMPACSCHLATPGAANGNLELTDAVAYMNIVDVASGDLPAMPYVTPMDPTNSYLWLKLTGDHIAAGGKGSKMPLGPALSQEQLDLVQGWILAGAVDD